MSRRGTFKVGDKVLATEVLARRWLNEYQLPPNVEGTVMYVGGGSPPIEVTWHIGSTVRVNTYDAIDLKISWMHKLELI